MKYGKVESCPICLAINKGFTKTYRVLANHIILAHGGHRMNDAERSKRYRENKTKQRKQRG